MSRAETESTTTAIKDLESDVHDLNHMAGIVVDRIERLLNSDDSSITGNPEFHWVTSEEANVHMFAVYRLHDMIRELKGKYFAALESHCDKPSSHGQQEAGLTTDKVMTEQRSTPKEIASDMEDDIATIADLAFTLQLIAQSPGLCHDHEGRAIERLAVKIQEHARTLERQRREAAGQTGA